MTTPTTDDVLATIHREGYAVVPGVVSKERLATLAGALSAAYQAQLAGGELFEGGGSISGHLNCFPGEGARFAWDDLEAGGVLDVVRAFDPVAFQRPRVTMNWNLPGSHEQHYHADGLFTEAFLVCNVAVVDTDLTNGAIDVLPGTHDRFYKYWQFSTQHLARRSARLSMQQGDVLLRISTLWHRGMPNHSARPRPLLSITFGESSAPDGDPFAQHDGKIVFYPNWYGTSRASRLQERVFVTAPWAYSSLRFTRSLVGNKGYSSW